MKITPKRFPFPPEKLTPPRTTAIITSLIIREVKSMGFEVLCRLALKGGLKRLADGVLADGIVSMKSRVRLQSTMCYLKKLRYVLDLQLGLDFKDKGVTFHSHILYYWPQFSPH
jgi:hypothetical protein